MNSTLTDIDLLARLVAFDSTSCNSNVPIAEYIADYVATPGLLVDWNYNEDRTKANLIIRVPCSGTKTAKGAAPTSDDQGGLALSGHLDTVPATEPEWKTDPWELADVDDRLVGRGACDMKGFVALAVNAVRAVRNRRLAHPLALILTFDEEPGILGAQHLAKTWSRPDSFPRATVVGEPTEMKVVRMHKGHLKMRVNFRGKSAHTAYAHLGVNAIEPAARVILSLGNMAGELREVPSRVREYFPDSPHATLTVTRIIGGTATNVVPDRCVLDFGVRLLPDMNPTELEARVRTAIARLGDLGEHTVEVIGLSPPFQSGEDTALFRSLREVLVNDKERGNRTAGLNPRRQSDSITAAQTADRGTARLEARDSIGIHTEAVSYASDAGPLQAMGQECVLFGPGSIEVAHKPNEWMPKSEFVAARGILDQLIERFCAP